MLTETRPYFFRVFCENQFSHKGNTLIYFTLKVIVLGYFKAHMLANTTGQANNARDMQLHCRNTLLLVSLPTCSASHLVICCVGKPLHVQLWITGWKNCAPDLFSCDNQDTMLLLVLLLCSHQLWYLAWPLSESALGLLTKHHSHR